MVSCRTAENDLTLRQKLAAFFVQKVSRFVDSYTIPIDLPLYMQYIALFCARIYGLPVVRR